MTTSPTTSSSFFSPSSSKNSDNELEEVGSKKRKSEEKQKTNSVSNDFFNLSVPLFSSSSSMQNSTKLESKKRKNDNDIDFNNNDFIIDKSASIFSNSLSSPESLFFSSSSSKNSDNELEEEGSKKRKSEEKQKTNSVSNFFNLPVPLFSSSSSSSSSSSLRLPMPNFSLSSRVNSGKKCPQAPGKSKYPSKEYDGYTLDHFTNPKIISEFNLKVYGNDGEYKTAWKIPEEQKPLIEGIPNEKLLILTFKENNRNSSAQKIYNNMETSLAQYEEAKKIFGSESCVLIYNEKTAIKDGYLIVEKIDHSLLDVYHTLNDDEQKKILLQIKKFFQLSINKKVDTDLNTGNFRLKIQDGNSYLVVLTDFRESIDEDDLIVNKKKEIENLKKHIDKEKIEEIFKDTIEDINKMSNQEFQ